jgi:RNA polymerase sigma-70 factor (ECF subfamily)
VTETDNRSLLTSALTRIAGGDRIGLQTVYRLTSAKLFGVCLRILGDTAEAEDILQEVYVTVWRKAGDFDAARASPMTWLITIARNRSIDRLRTRAARRAAPLETAADIIDPAPSAQADLERSQEHARLRRCLDGLNDREQAALRGAYFDGRTYEEMAARMSLPLGTMKSTIRRALMKLKECLQR